MSDARPFSHIAFFGMAKDCLPDAGFRALAKQLSAAAQAGPSPSLVVALASELLGRDGLRLPDWVDTDTRYLVVLDVPEQAVLRLASMPSTPQAGSAAAGVPGSFRREAAGHRAQATGRVGGHP